MKIYPFIFLSALILPGIAKSQVVNIASGTQLVAQGNISLVIDQGGMKNDGVFIPGNSTVFFDGGTVNTISGTQPIQFFNATFRGTGNKVNAGNASVINTLAVEGTTVLDADGTTNDKPFTLLSSDTLTARVDILTTGNVIGDVTVERFINTGTGTGEHGKSWQFLATPTTGQTYFQSWQEGGLSPAGYGTWITGTGTGFDATTVLPSLKYYNAAGINWTPVTNTGLPLQNKLGYMLFVRGDRTVNTVGGTPNNTNMRSKGVLFTPVNPPASIAVAANQFQTFGNPYASRIEFNKVLLSSTGIRDVFYAWDPKLNGTYNLGGYQTISGLAGYIPTAGNSTDYYPGGVPAPYIESGQAVFIQGNATGGNVNFNENNKVSGSRLVNRGNDIIPQTRALLFTTLFSNSGKIADGNIVAFENGLGNNLNDLDAVKIMNAGENLAIAREGNLLAVEARDNVVVTDTVFYHFQNLRHQGYQLRFVPVNMPSTLTAYLYDRANDSYTNISLTDSSFVDFTVDGASATPGRFLLVFRKSVVLPVSILDISAKRNSDKTNTVNWKVANEYNLQHYTVEKSIDGRNFAGLGMQFPVTNNGGNAAYSFIDQAPFAGVNFYRVKSTSNNGQIQFSNIVKVYPEAMDMEIVIHPNPVIDNTINVVLKNLQPGIYTFQLTNTIGQVILTKEQFINQAEYIELIKPAAKFSPGTYQLLIIKPDGTKETQQVIVQ